MMTTKGKPQRQEIKPEMILQLKDDFSLKFREPKQKVNLCLRNVVELMEEPLLRALDNGWTLRDCCEFLAERGVKISPNTLQQYLRDLKSSQPTSNGTANVAVDSISPEIAQDQSSKDNSTTHPLDDIKGVDKQEKRFNKLNRSRL